MNFIKKELKQGITLHYISCDKFTSNSFTVHFLLPLCKESASKYCLLSRVLKKACAKYPSQEKINKRLEELYAASVGMGVTKLGENESLFVSTNMLDDRFAFDGMAIEKDTLSLAEEILFFPLLENGAFSNAIVDREKKTLIDRIRAQINQKSAYALSRCREIMCEDEAYSLSLMGTEEDVQKIGSAELYNAYSFILSHARVEMIYIGNTSFVDVCASAEHMAERLSPREAPSLKTEVRFVAERVRHVKEEVHATQGNLVMGFRIACRGNDKDALAVMLLDAVYGSSPVSKLFMNVRERLSLCYHCASRYDRHKGIMMVSAGIENKNAEIAEKEILAQLNEIKNGNVTEKELIYAKESLCDALRSVTDVQSSMESWRLHQTVRDSYSSPDETIEIIRKMTVEDIVRVANKITLDTVYFLKGDGGEEDGADV